MTEITEAVDVEEALRLAEVGEYLYDKKAFSAGNGYDEPREFSICWDWQQSKPNEYGQGVLLAEAVAWHREMAADGIETQANKLRAELTRLQEEVEGLRGALESIALRANGEPWPDHFAPEPPDWAQDEYGCAASCGYCGAWMTIVRPGKHQCDNCSDGQDVGAIACDLLQAAREEASGAGNKIAAGLSEALAFAKGDASSATVRHVRAPSQGAGEPVAWPISVDGPHKITDQRAWLARQLMDSKNSDEEAFGIVAYHPAIRGARPANDRTKALEEALETARDALQAAYQRTGHADDLAAAHIADAALLRTLETSNV